jgi:hypothetical protein
MTDADMMEIGVTATGGLSDCGLNGTSLCVPLNVTEARTHFAGWYKLDAIAAVPCHCHCVLRAAFRRSSVPPLCLVTTPLALLAGVSFLHP